MTKARRRNFEIIEATIDSLMASLGDTVVLKIVSLVKRIYGCYITITFIRNEELVVLKFLLPARCLNPLNGKSHTGKRFVPPDNSRIASCYPNLIADASPVQFSTIKLTGKRGWFSDGAVRAVDGH